MAEWLDTAFHGFDRAILSALHDFALSTGDGFGWFFRFISIITLDGFGLFIPGFVLLFFKRTRKIGAVMFGAVAIGAVITNLAVKPLVARARPFMLDEIRAWWEFAGATQESAGSFPSGHTTATTAAMVGLFLAGRKKYVWPALLCIPVMGLSRLYLMVHYPTDILGGILVGTVAALLALLIVRWIWRLLEAHADARFPAFALGFDPIVSCVRRVRTRKEPDTVSENGDAPVETSNDAPTEDPAGPPSGGADEPR